MLLTAAEVTQAAEVALPRIQIETTVIDMPESLWDQMAGAGTWKVIPGQPTWKQFVVSTNRKKQEALVHAWFGNNVSDKYTTFLPSVFRVINQTKYVYMCTPPKVVGKTKQYCTVEINRELKYATSWKPGFMEQDPWTPNAHAQKSIGFTINVQPTLLSDENISLYLAPQFTELMGYKNLGHGRDQPIFCERKVKTKVALQNGQTVILAVAGPEIEQTVEDNVPLLGDLPLLGRLFRKSSKTSFKNYQVIFVTPRIIRRQ